MRRFSRSATLPVIKMATAAGTKVTANTKAPINAATTVNAMGWNIFPSTPLSAKIGRYTSMIMNMPNTAGLKTSRVLSITSAKRSCTLNIRPRRCCARPSRRKAFSTTMTAPSTIRPKSIAPRLIKFPDTRLLTMPVTANNMLNGITKAVISAARILPNIKNNTTTTSKAPSNKFFCTVLRVLSTSVVRS